MANEGLWQQLLKLDGQQTARRADCRYEDDSRRYVITLLNKEYIVDLLERRVVSPKGSCQATFGVELCILAYLINARDLPIADKLTPAESLSDGQFFFRGPHKLPTEKLQEVFGQCPQRLFEIADSFAAERQEFGDASIQLYVLPRVPLTVVVWRGDEEFPARASVLFDQTAAEQLPLDALGMAANLTVKALADAAVPPA